MYLLNVGRKIISPAYGLGGYRLWAAVG